MSGKDYLLEYQTPVPVCKYMVSLIPDGVVTVLEPTPGIGNIVNELKDYQVTAPDDFFLMGKRWFDCVVMNPPFTSKSAILDNAPNEYLTTGMKFGYQLLLDCMKMSNNVIALMPWFTISDSDVRLRMIKRFGLKSVTALPRKTFEYARIQTVILEMQKGFSDNTLFKVFDCLQDHKINGLEFS